MPALLMPVNKLIYTLSINDCQYKHNFEKLKHVLVAAGQDKQFNICFTPVNFVGFDNSFHYSAGHCTEQNSRVRQNEKNPHWMRELN